MVQQERDYSGMETDVRMRMLQNDFEMVIEKKIGAKQIADGHIKMYKGTIKKWQILDDEAHDRDQIEKMQAAVQAPLPDELEMYRDRIEVPMQLPFNNENVRAWRDEPDAIDSADFDPENLLVSKDRRKRFFIERFEQPL